MKREIVLIVARASNGVIGRDGDLPWHIPEDLRHFKALTVGTPMIMGRKTFDSLPGLLPGRRHIVITRNATWFAEGAEVAPSLEDAMSMAGSGTISIIGGAEIFQLALPYADRIELTEVHVAPAGDTVLPPFDGWAEVARSPHAGFDFVTLRRG
ncbi:dihydrofolate reductase [Sphingomonas jejuensis]|uniref:Dihydrofolate reductase n=1 Tax=Sphingomonas jejuensis TaxID=904715 RepID=A0ABX0XMG3_9SPHN|nr:dihydrofolate reductase [Sphingomonas jejuensis]NJC33947.1 dihydrofolate reductase [Sphingomonas jejuensis]